MSKTSNQDLYDLLAKRLAGETNAKEEKALDQWVESSDEAKEALSNAHHIWTSDPFESNNSKLVGQEEASEKIWNEVFENDRRRKPHRDYSMLAKIAATIIIFFSAAFVVFHLVKSPNVEEPSISTISKQTLPGQKSTITLPDGSIVWLNSGSSISYQSNYNDSLRVIQLEGQAFFDVFKDAQRPFIVKCRDLEIEALGTSFDVDGYKNTPIQVSLLTGSVRLTIPKIHNAGDAVILSPGEYSVLSQENEFIEKGKFDSYEVLAWKEGRIIFNNATIGEMIPKLELWYGMEIENQLKINLNKPFSSTFEKENLQNILMNIGEVLEFEVTFKDNKTVTIKN